MEQLEQDIIKFKNEENICKIRSVLAKFCKNSITKKEYVEIFKFLNKIGYNRDRIIWLLRNPFKNLWTVSKILKSEQISDTIYGYLCDSMKCLEFKDIYVHNSYLTTSWNKFSELLKDGSNANITIFKQRMEIEIGTELYIFTFDDENIEVDIKDGTFVKYFKDTIGGFDMKLEFSVSKIHENPNHSLKILTDHRSNNQWITIVDLDMENIQDFINLLKIEY
jgi:hypothetical protein